MDKRNRWSEIILAFFSWVLIVLAITLFVLSILLLPWAFATVKDADLLPTPKGTIVFLFTSIHSLRIKLESKIMVVYLAYFTELISTLSGGFFNVAISQSSFHGNPTIFLCSKCVLT